MTMHRTVALLVVLAALAVGGCRTAPIYNPTDIAYAPAATSGRSLSRSDYRNAIIRAGAERGWTFEDAGQGHLIGNLAVRGKHFATVDVFYDSDSFTINYRDSRNLNYDAAKREIHPNYNSWVTNLQQDIQAEIARLATS
jgi:hypothetical protein